MDNKKIEDGLLERAADVFDLPGDIIAGLPRIQIVGCNELLMENHKGILEYGEDKIDINGGKVMVRIRGNKLELRAMSSRELLIAGHILNIEFIFN